MSNAWLNQQLRKMTPGIKAGKTRKRNVDSCKKVGVSEIELKSAVKAKGWRVAQVGDDYVFAPPQLHDPPNRVTCPVSIKEMGRSIEVDAPRVRRRGVTEVNRWRAVSGRVHGTAIARHGNRRLVLFSPERKRLTTLETKRFCHRSTVKWRALRLRGIGLRLLPLD